MASGSSLSCEEQLLCPICLEVFKEPVTTPCGHNYCKTCITDYWDTSSQTRCPLCKKRFRQRPALRCNTSFRDVLDHLRNLCLLSPTEEQLAGPGDVSCDICLEPKHKALKTCVVCAASYCSLHLEPHQRVPSLKKHQLTDPLPDLERRVCWRHGQMLDFFCAIDQMCVCLTCTEDDHALHRCVPLDQAFEEERAAARREIAQLTAAEDAQTRHVNQTRAHVEQRRKRKEADVADVEEAFVALVDSLMGDKQRLVQAIEQKYEEALKEPQDRVCRLQASVMELQQQRAELEEALQMEDPLQFLQSKLDVPLPPPHEDLLMQTDCDDEETYGGAVKAAAEEMKMILSEEMDRLIQRVRNPDEVDFAGMPLQIWIPPRDELMMIQQNDAVQLTLDPYTAHPFLSIFKNGKGLSYNPAKPNPPRTWFFHRHFQNFPFVLSTDGFSSGRFYFEVRVSGATDWVLGVVRESFNRNLPCQWLPGPKNGAWILSSLTMGSGSYFESPNMNLQKVGVFVDYEKAEVSFYDVDSRVLMTSFRECAFNEPVPFLKSALYSLVGVKTSTRTKLYPVFGAYQFYNSLQITPVESGDAANDVDAQWLRAPWCCGFDYSRRPLAQAFYRSLSPFYASTVQSNKVFGPKTNLKKRKKKKKEIAPVPAIQA